MIIWVFWILCFPSIISLSSPHAEASLGFREAEKREKESAREDAFPSFQRSPHVYNFYFDYYRFFHEIPEGASV